MHQSGKTGAAGRKLRKAVVKTSWFRMNQKNNGEPEPSSIRSTRGRKPQEQFRINSALFVSRTPNGTLAESIRRVEMKYRRKDGISLRIVEEAGRSLKETLHGPDPWGKQECERQNRAGCIAPEVKQGSCKTRSVTYESVCRLCLKEEKTTKYIGETARDIFLKELNTMQTLA